MSGMVRFSLLCLATMAMAAAPERAGATDAPAFQIRERQPEVSVRTLDLVRNAERPPTKIWVYFTDKNVFDSETAAARLAEVRESLSPKAAARRGRMIDGLVDYHDIAVHDRYIARLEELGAEVRRQSRWLNAVSVVAPLAALEEIAGERFVQKLVPVGGATRAYPEVRVHEGNAVGAPGDAPRAAGTINYGPSEAQLTEINVINAHNTGLSGAGVRIATLDTGFQHVHEAFSDIIGSGRLIDQWDFVNDDAETQNEPGDDASSHNHGTFTWSAMGGFTDGQLVGPAYGAEFLLAKTEDVTSETQVEEDNWCAAAEWADTNGADIITTSLGYLDWYTYPDMDGETAAITNCADLAVSRGIVVVTSAGNQGAQPWFYITAPADADDIISVGAADDQNVVASFSSHGPTFDGRTKPEVVARGVETWCAIPPDLGASYFGLNGTSLSAPLVAGVCALVLEQNPTWTPLQVRTALMLTADTATSPDNDRGWGRVDAMAAMAATVATQEVPPATSPASVAPRILAAPNPLSSGTVLTFALGERAHGVIEIFDIAGRLVSRWDTRGATGVLRWDARDLTGRLVAPGVYVGRLTTGAWRSNVKLVVDR